MQEEASGTDSNLSLAVSVERKTVKLFQSKNFQIFTFAFHIFQCMNLVFGILMLVTISIVTTGGLWLLFFSSKPQTAMEMIIGNKRGLIVNNTGLDPLAQPFKG